ncbi:glucosamine 6-phosphate n-acetyltransferase [Anaeramoeba flamelloides]|uniref:Glucosamine 6-phosphate n-acetyltransferase n=1 Tax=Anaeramoeba flamelloides TaxID=1746091 RepID=A0AAV7ZDL1_9EUKA|nr:glucosamine 6-phosphate n-acetyltransferase [Anaeramoeba flamelloides]
MEIEFKWIDTEEALFEQVQTHRWINLLQPLGISFDYLENPNDQRPNSFHLVAMRDDKVVGSCSLFHVEGSDRAKFYQMSVKKEFRGKGVGKKIILEMIRTLKEDQKIKTKNKLFEKKLNVLYCHGLQFAIGFYERLNFKKVGEMFVEEGYEHYKMEYDLNL